MKKMWRNTIIFSIPFISYARYLVLRETVFDLFSHFRHGTEINNLLDWHLLLNALTTELIVLQRPQVTGIEVPVRSQP